MLKADVYLNIKTNKTMNQLELLSKEELGAFLAPLTDLASNMILAGVLKKNAIKHFTNKNIPFEVAENLVQVGVVKAEQFKVNKSK